MRKNSSSGGFYSCLEIHKVECVFVVCSFNKISRALTNAPLHKGLNAFLVQWCEKIDTMIILHETSELSVAF